MTVRRPGGVGLTFWCRRLRAEWVLVVAMGVSMLVATTSLAAMPRIFEHASASDVRHTIAEAEPERRNISLRLDARMGAYVDPAAHIDERGAALLEQLVPDTVLAVISDRWYVVDTPTFDVTTYPERTRGPFPTTFGFRFHQGIEGESRLVAGDLPEVHEPIEELAGSDCPPEPDAIATFVPSDDVDCELIEIPVIETAITAQTAADIGVGVGDRVTLTPNLTEPRWHLVGLADLRMVLEVVGIVELSDLSREYWYADNRLHGPRITENADFRRIAATGLVLPDQYAQLLAAVPRIDFAYTWRFLVDPDLVDVGTASEIAIELANAQPRSAELETGLPGLIGEYAAQREVVLVLLSTVAFGLAVVAAAVLVALAVLMATRQDGAASVVIARGAARRHLVVDAIRTAVVLVVPAAVIGSTIAALAVESTSARPAVLVVTVFALSSASAIVVSGTPRSRRGDRTARRIVAELAVLVATVAAVFATRRRGAITGDGVAELDIVSTVAPGLVVVCGALIGVRLVGPLARAGGRVADRRRGLVLFVGLRRLVARPVMSRGATAAMLVSVGVAVFAVSANASIERGREASSWYDVGADLTIEAPLSGAPLPRAVDRLDPGPGVATAERTVYRGAAVSSGRDSTSIDVVAIDADAYRTVLSGAPIRMPPLELLTAPESGGRPTALVSSNWPRGSPPTRSDVLVLDLGSGPLEVTVAAALDVFPAVVAGRPFVIVDRGGLGEVGAARPTALHAGGSSAAIADLADRVAADVPATRLSERSDVLDELAEDPLSGWTVRLLRLVFVLASVFAAVAAASAVAIAVVARTTETAVVRTLGLDARSLGTLTAVEHVPVVTMAAVVGALAGAAAFELLLPALGLARFAGPGRPVDATVDLRATLESVALLAITMGAALAIAMRAQRRTDLAATLRVGET